MASAVFAPAREGFLSGEISWNVGTIKVALCRGYSYNAAHKYVSQIGTAGGTFVATATLAGKTVTDGVADANDLTFSTVPSGADITSLIYFQSSAVSGGADLAATAQRLIAFVDTAQNLPLQPNGGNVDLVHSNDSSRIFRI